MAVENDLAGHAKKKIGIAEIFAGKSVLITGVQGIVGKVLLEKILRCCPAVEQVYVLLKSKEDINYKEILNEMMKNRLFDRVRREQPESLFKVIPVCGDIMYRGLMLDDCNTKILINEVNFVFNCCFIVRFDDSYTYAFAMNLIGAINQIDFASRMKNLMAVVHLSTAYSFCNRDKIYERVYLEFVRPEDMLSVLQWMEEPDIRYILKTVNNRGNLYHYVAALAESYLNSQETGVPLAIVRPSIVSAAWKEPYPGWVETFAGPTGLLLAWGKGVMRTIYGNKALKADFVPVDIVVNTLLAAAHSIAVDKSSSPLVLNCVSRSSQPLRWGDIERIGYPILLKYPCTRVFRYPGGSLKSSKFVNCLAVWVHHWTSAAIVDILTFTWKDISMAASYRNIHMMMKNSEFFMTTKCNFFAPNMQKLQSQMSEADSLVFSINMENLDWKSYLDDYIHGLRKYIVYESDNTLDESIERMNKVYWIWVALHTTAILTSFTLISVLCPNRISSFITTQISTTNRRCIGFLLKFSKALIRSDKIARVFSRLFSR